MAVVCISGSGSGAGGGHAGSGKGIGMRWPSAKRWKENFLDSLSLKLSRTVFGTATGLVLVLSVTGIVRSQQRWAPREQGILTSIQACILFLQRNGCCASFPQAVRFCSVF